MEKVPYIYLSPPHMSGDEFSFVQEAIEGNWVSPVGPHLDAFELALENCLSVPYALALSSGTASLHLALAVLGVESGDIVFCQSLTFVASANPILYQGGVPVFIGSERESWNMCPEALETAFKVFDQRGKLPKAVIIVHLFGMPANMDAIMPICKQYGVPVIEDAAEALGSIYSDQYLGAIGDMGILSFNGNKIITTSAGGALLTSEQQWIEKGRFLASQARESMPYYQHEERGYNYRMSNICAGIGRAQLNSLFSRVAARRANFNFYQKHLENVQGLSFQPEASGSVSNRWLTAFTLDPTRRGEVDPERIRTAMLEQGIETRRIWKPMHLQPLFRDAAYVGSQVSEELFASGLCLPSGSALTQALLHRIVNELTKLLT